MILKRTPYCLLQSYNKDCPEDFDSNIWQMKYRKSKVIFILYTEKLNLVTLYFCQRLPKQVFHESSFNHYFALQLRLKTTMLPEESRSLFIGNRLHRSILCLRRDNGSIRHVMCDWNVGRSTPVSSLTLYAATLPAVTLFYVTYECSEELEL